MNKEELYARDQMMLDEMLYARDAEIKDYGDLLEQRGTPIPALFNVFYKFIQNPSSVSVETFKRMVDTDDTVGSGCDFLATCLTARMGDYQHKSPEITKWVNDVLSSMEDGWANSMKEMLSATWAGFSITEKIWANTEKGFVPKKLVTLPPSTLLFEVDRVGTIVPDGILQFQRNYNPAMLGMGSLYLFGFAGPSFSGPSSAAYRPDAYAKFGDMPYPIRSGNTFSYLSIRVPRDKVIHYSFDAQGKFGNPYGRSLLRRAYDWWVMKKAFMQMLATALDRKGTPLTVVYADPNTTVMDRSKTAQRNNAGNRAVGISAQEAAMKAFSNVHNDSTIFLPGKKGQIFDTDFIEQVSNQDSFIQAIELCNKSIMRAQLIPALVFNGGDGSGSYALGEAHTKTFDKILDSMLSGFAQTLKMQFIQQILAYNFPRSAWEKDGIGDFGKRELTTEERDKEMDVVDKAVNVGAIDTNDLNDLNKIREKAGFEPLHKVPVRPEMGVPGDDGEGEDDPDAKDTTDKQ